MCNPKVSIVINTYNRVNHLKRLLDCLLQQTYDDFEIIVVNGPSTDNTESMLEEYKDVIKKRSCSLANLCVSRNVGINAAEGEIIGFIDDDAVPENIFWIERAIAYFESKDIGAVGGSSYKINGDVEFEYGCFSIWGDNISRKEQINYPLEEGWYRGVIGNNCFFKKDILLQIGGFDEFYEYYLDETDLCFRIAKTGKSVIHGLNMSIIHEAAVGSNRKSKYDLRWDIIARSKCYFVAKALKESNIDEKIIKKELPKCCNNWKNEFDVLEKNDIISKEQKSDYMSLIEKGMVDGIENGLNKERLLNGLKIESKEFRKVIKQKKHLSICLLCEDDTINPTGGVQVYTKALADGLSREGHNIFIITKGSEEKLSNINGINYCYINPKKMDLIGLENMSISKYRFEFSYSCYKMVQKLKRSFGIELVESPIWDTYGLILSYLENDIPVVTRLQTPLKMVMKTFAIEESKDLSLMTKYEYALMKKSSYIITISNSVKNTIEELYGFSFTQPVKLNYLGIDPTNEKINKERNDDKIVIFFIGRIERRKGIHNILESLPLLMEKYPNLVVRLAGDCDIVDNIIGKPFKDFFGLKYGKEGWYNRVIFMGKISEEEKEKEYANCDIFVSPSLYESFGIIFIEAMKHKKPVIGCDIGGMKEVIDNGNTGLLSQPDNTDSFRECLEELICDKEKRINMGQAGYERFKSMFTTEAMCKKCLEIYKNIIHDSNNI